MMIYIPLFFFASILLWRTSGSATAITCAADARKYIAKILAAESAAHQKVLRHKSRDFAPML